MSNISIDNLDLGYEQCKTISDSIENEGNAVLLKEFRDTIDDLKTYWKSNDATEHINNLIAMYRTLGGHLNSLKANIKSSADGIIGIQTLRSANGGNGQIGAKLGDSIDVVAITDAVPTEEYNMDAEQTKRIHARLKALSDSYEEYMTRTNNNKDTLLTNWKKGANRESVREAFEVLSSQKEKNKELFANAISKLGEAFSNTDKL